MSEEPGGEETKLERVGATGQAEEVAADSKPAKPKPTPRQLFLRGVRAVLIAVATVAAIPVIIQNRLIYFGRRYDPIFKPGEGQLKDFRQYKTADGRTQWGLLFPPAPLPPGEVATAPRLYLVFNGNASSAMDTGDFFEKLARRTGVGFFLCDYRSYGFNDGKATEAGLHADAIGAYDTLAAEGLFVGGPGVIGHSLGGGAAIAVASERPVTRLITLSTFTSIDDMARRTVPWPIYLFCWNHWPNAERLREITSRPPEKRPASITLIHGTADEVVPFEMGEALAKLCGDKATFIPIRNGTHNDILEFAEQELVKLVK